MTLYFGKYILQLEICLKITQKNLPKHDAIITLEDEDGQYYYAEYLSSSLSVGSRNFRIEHRLNRRHHSKLYGNVIVLSSIIQCYKTLPLENIIIFVTFGRLGTCWPPFLPL